MGDVVRFRKPDLKDKARGRTLCTSGFHKWKVQTGRRFDTRQGRLVTVYRCERCGATRVKAL